MRARVGGWEGAGVEGEGSRAGVEGEGSMSMGEGAIVGEAVVGGQ